MINVCGLGVKEAGSSPNRARLPYGQPLQGMGQLHVHEYDAGCKQAQMAVLSEGLALT